MNDGRILVTAMDYAVKEAEQRLDSLDRVIQANSPERQLRFGYSIVYNRGKIVRSHKDVKPGETLEIRTAEGVIGAKVENK
jgi:exodeoxyribonuclease VII large subunit